MPKNPNYIRYVNSEGALVRLPKEQLSIDDLMTEIREELDSNGSTNRTYKSIGSVLLAEKPAEQNVSGT